MDLSAQRELAVLLATLRRDGRQQSGLDARLVPPDQATAYRVAARVAEELGWTVGGWKIAAMKAEMQKALRTDQPIYGRVFSPFVKPSPVTVVHAKLASPIPEVEYQAKLGADLPPRAKPYTVEEVADSVASLHPGLELAECRFIHDQAFPPLPAILADGAGSGTIVYGPAIDGWRTRDIAGQEATLSCRRQAPPQRHGRRRARSSPGAAHLARQRTVAHRRRPEGGADDQHRHAHRHAGAQAGRDLSRGFRAVRHGHSVVHLTRKHHRPVAHRAEAQA